MIRTLALLVIALLPSALKIPLYRRLFGWQIGMDVRIGWSYLDAQVVRIGDGVRIGRFNRFQRLGRLDLERTAHIGNRNVFITGPSAALADVRDACPELYVGEDSYIIGPHFFDVHAPIRIGRSVTLAGRGSSFYTHGRDFHDNCIAAEPITIGENSYVGAHALFAPGGGHCSEHYRGHGRAGHAGFRGGIRADRQSAGPGGEGARPQRPAFHPAAARLPRGATRRSGGLLTYAHRH